MTIENKRIIPAPEGQAKLEESLRSYRFTVGKNDLAGLNELKEFVEYRISSINKHSKR